MSHIVIRKHSPAKQVSRFAQQGADIGTALCLIRDVAANQASGLIEYIMYLERSAVRFGLIRFASIKFNQMNMAWVLRCILVVISPGRLRGGET